MVFTLRIWHQETLTKPLLFSHYHELTWLSTVITISITIVRPRLNGGKWDHKLTWPENLLFLDAEESLNRLAGFKLPTRILPRTCFTCMGRQARSTGSVHCLLLLETGVLEPASCKIRSTHTPVLSRDGDSFHGCCGNLTTFLPKIWTDSLRSNDPNRLEPLGCFVEEKASRHTVPCHLSF